ncbi:hypothetical protein SG34_020260 [Thalassomonas viridans]|uniref:Uncharacterized protein n=1 Tax=Thalassomonas viridans TaxID=137584 RepID=A0AAE9YZZ3_9GAMM|nr:hypothetical protein [Thalassomonas viridans]WDE03697.1 hypothetical protein SG34_020260 [Thalassomonas viridans]
MFELLTENWFIYGAGILFFICAFCSVCFSRISIKHIEKEMAKEGKSPPDWDKGIGARVGAYAVALIIKRIPPHSIIDTKAVKRHARKKDIFLAGLFLSSLVLFITVAGVGYFIYGSE